MSVEAEIADVVGEELVHHEVLRDGRPQLRHFGIPDSDAWDVGLPCGGEIDVWVERYEP